MVLIAIAVKVSSPGPVFFRQVRIGRWGRHFKVNKFRTMRNRHGDSSTITVSGDSRVTKVGKFLRKWKLDELPQVFNIIAGDMSFVGPRPDVPGYWDRLTGEPRRVLEFRPGITGPATLKYANEESILAAQSDPRKYNDEVIFPDKVRINLKYMEDCTFTKDLHFIIGTVLK